MFKYRKLLKQILNMYVDKSYRELIHFDRNEDIHKYEYLESKRLISIKRYVGGDFAINLTDFGIIYFEERRDKLIQFWIPTIISIFALLKSFQTEITWLLQLLVQVLK